MVYGLHLQYCLNDSFSLSPSSYWTLSPGSFRCRQKADHKSAQIILLAQHLLPEACHPVGPIRKLKMKATSDCKTQQP